jgi:hypothetical protein
MRRLAWSYRLLAWTLGILVCASLGLTLQSQGKPLRSIRSWAHRAAAAGSVPAQRSDARARATDRQRADVQGRYAELPLAFEPNAGQTDGRVRYLARGSGYTIFLTDQKTVLSLTRRTPARGSHRASTTSTVLDLRFTGSNPSPRISTADQLSGKSNYFVGKNPAQWHVDIPRYAKVTFDEVYPGVGVVYYGRNRQLEQDWVVSPGADPSRIAFEVEGANRLALDSHGDLRVLLPDGELRLLKPAIYQLANSTGGARTAVKGGFVVARDRRVRFQVGSYDHAKPLIIDPVIVYSSYLGGTSADQANAVTIDSAGDAYVAGDTTSVDFPVTSGVLQSTCKLDSFGICERSAFVSEINAGGTAEVFSTYLGGSSSQIALGVAVDAAGDAFVAGQTTSTDFPTLNPYQPACSLDANNVCYDAFVAVIKAGGSALLYSSYLGGSGVDSANSIAIDSTGNAYITGQTASTNFPTTSGVIQTMCGTDGQCNLNASTGLAQPDTFVAKVNTTASGASSLVYSTYLGGSGADYGTAIGLDSSLNAYITGSTSSTDLPATTGAFQSSCKLDSTGVCEGGPFVAKLNPTATALVYLTYLGGSGGGGLDTAHGLALDSSGNAYIAGQTGSTDFPVTSGAFQTSCGTDGQCNPVNGVATPHAFIAKLNSGGSALVYSTYLGGSSMDFASAISVDSANVPYVTGGTYSTDFPISNALSTGGALAGGEDAFITALNSQGTGLIISTYLGGAANDVGNGVVRDASDDVFVAGSTASTNFPTAAPFQAANAGSTDAFVTELGSVTAPVVTLTPSTLTFAAQDVSTTSAAQVATLSNIGNEALTITSIATTGNFAETNACGASLAAGASCTISVTFGPTTTGALTGTLTVTDNASTSPQSVSLAGTGVAPAVTLTPTTLSFASQIVNSAASAPQTVTMTNVGTATLNITSIKLTGADASDFSLTSACGATLAVGKSCTMTVAFAPKAGGTLTASISVTDNASGSPQTVSITGLGADFLLSISQNTTHTGNSVNPGYEAIYNVGITPIGGFDEEVTIACAGAPSEATCVVHPPATVPTAGKVEVFVSFDVFTTAPTSAPPGPGSRRIPPLGPEGRRIVWLGALGMGLALLVLRKRRSTIVLALALLAIMAWGSCGSSANSIVLNTTHNAGTPAGTYTLTVTATSTSITHTITTPLTVL